MKAEETGWVGEGRGASLTKHTHTPARINAGIPEYLSSDYIQMSTLLYIILIFIRSNCKRNVGSRHSSAPLENIPRCINHAINQVKFKGDEENI